MIVSPRRLICGVLLLGMLVTASFTVLAQDVMDPWRTFAFSATTIKASQIQPLALEDLKLLRGIVFGRHGRVFKDAEIKTYLEAQDWFKPNPDFKNSVLNDTERRNLDLIRIAEAGKHTTIQPGDMRFWVSRPITAKKLGTHSGAEWKVLIAEVEAIHGKKFDDDPWLQQYFEERYWYFPSDKYDAKKLSTIEQKHREIVRRAQ